MGARRSGRVVGVAQLHRVATPAAGIRRAVQHYVTRTPSSNVVGLRIGQRGLFGQPRFMSTIDNSGEDDDPPKKDDGEDDIIDEETPQRVVVDVETGDVTEQTTEEVTEIAVSDRPFSYSNMLVLAIGRRPLLPGIIHPFLVEDPAIIEQLKKQRESGNAYVSAFAVRDASNITNEGIQSIDSLDEVYDVGVLAQIIELQRIPDFHPGAKANDDAAAAAAEEDGEDTSDGSSTGKWRVLLQATRRVTMDGSIEPAEDSTYRADISSVKEDSSETFATTESAKAYTAEIMGTIKDILKHNPLFKEQLQVFIERVDVTRPAQLADFGAALTTAEPDELQEVLEATTLQERMEKALLLLKKELAMSRLQQDIGKQVEEKITKDQRRYLLTEQLKKIKKELGLEKDEKEGLLDRYKARLEGIDLPEHAETVINDEFAKIEALDPSSSEYNVSKNYLDWLTVMPWNQHSDDNFDVKTARGILDEDHYGIDDVKERILEFIAVGKLRGNVQGRILILHGPPGTGKTSIGSSISRALDRKFFRFSVGGMTDVSEIKGHRRTYIGAMPGKLIQSLKVTQTANPVILIDEIDKMGRSFQGDPSSALLEVLDPEQNSGFLDHYLDCPFDISKALFICTANDLDTIPRPLLDRMEVISMSGYVMEEKVEIAKRYLMPRCLEETGLTEGQVVIDDDAMRAVIRQYAREAGVRNLQKQLEKIHRKVSLQVVQHGLGNTFRAARFLEMGAPQTTISTDNLEEYLGNPRFTSDRLYDETPPGVVMGLAYTQMGGATLYIETIVSDRNKGLQTTGRMGEVMKESSGIAHTYADKFLRVVDPENDMLRGERGMHMHIPEGATPKDGPSAGISMATSLLSHALGKPVRNNLAMTGEITLTGKVLPVGGIKEKTIAAKRSGVDTIILPDANKKDFEELQDHIKDGITVHYAEYYQDVFDVAFGEEGTAASRVL